VPTSLDSRTLRSPTSRGRARQHPYRGSRGRGRDRRARALTTRSRTAGASWGPVRSQQFPLSHILLGFLISALRGPKLQTRAATGGFTFAVAEVGCARARRDGEGNVTVATHAPPDCNPRRSRFPDLTSLSAPEAHVRSTTHSHRVTCSRRWPRGDGRRLQHDLPQARARQPGAGRPGSDHSSCLPIAGRRPGAELNAGAVVMNVTPRPSLPLSWLLHLCGRGQCRTRTVEPQHGPPDRPRREPRVGESSAPTRRGPYNNAGHNSTLLGDVVGVGAGPQVISSGSRRLALDTRLPAIGGPRRVDRRPRCAAASSRCPPRAPGRGGQHHVPPLPQSPTYLTPCGERRAPPTTRRTLNVSLGQNRAQPGLLPPDRDNGKNLDLQRTRGPQRRAGRRGGLHRRRRLVRPVNPVRSGQPATAPDTTACSRHQPEHALLALVPPDFTSTSTTSSQPSFEAPPSVRWPCSCSNATAGRSTHPGNLTVFPGWAPSHGVSTSRDRRGRSCRTRGW